MVVGDATKDVENIVVFSEPGRYGGWPANGGIWHWDNEIVVVFTAAYYKLVKSGHAVDFEKPFEVWQARSTDGGDSWSIEKPKGLVPPELGGRKPEPLRHPINFKHPNFALMFKYTSQDVGPSRYYTSTDRCRTWQGPYELIVDGVNQIAARTDYIVRGRHDCVMFGSAAKSNHREGRVFCAETNDGGLSWKLVSRIGPEPDGYIIMPSTVRLASHSYFTTLRHLDPGVQGSIDTYLSMDSGRTWEYLGQAAPNIGGGNPPSLLHLADGRLALVYGYRAKPFGLRARISSDSGRTWSNEIVLRDDGATGDLGYTRSIQRPDGKVVSVYYFNGPDDRERTIQATIWQP
jgi:hypothetical protein